MSKKQLVNSTAEKNVAITAERAMSILELLERFDVPVPLKKITENIGLSQTAVFRLVSTLERKGFVHRSSHPKGYTLGWRIATMANTLLRQMSHVEEVNSILAELTSRTGQTTSMHMLSGYSSVCVSSYQGKSGYIIPVGLSSPIMRTAGGKAMLAFTQAQLPLAIKANERSLRAWNIMPGEQPSIQELNATRRTGIAYSFGELVPGLSSVATPLFSGGMSILGSLSISGSVADWTREAMQEWTNEIRQKAALISESFGATEMPEWHDEAENAESGN